MNELKIFDNPEFGQVRTTFINNEPWFAAKDVCEVFGETNYRRAIQSLDDDEKGVSQMSTPGGAQDLTIVNEGGLYTLLFAMYPEKARGVTDEYIADRKQKLRNFKRWVTHEVLPSIRKTGYYAAISELEQQIKALTAEKEPMSLTEFAKQMFKGGCKLGRNKLLEAMRADGWLNYISINSKKYNIPTQKSIDDGHMIAESYTATMAWGNFSITSAKITPTGYLFFLKLYS